MSENRPIKEPTEIEEDFQKPKCGLTRDELTNKKPNEACDDENCKAPVFCHPSLNPLCKLTQEKIESNKPDYMTTNGFCIECLSMKVCCRVGAHPSRESSESSGKKTVSFADISEQISEFKNEIKRQIINTKKEITNTKKEITNTKKEITNTKKEVINTKNEMKEELTFIKKHIEAHPWSNMSQTSDGKGIFTRELFFKEFGLGNQKGMPYVAPICMLTGIAPPKPSENIRVAHIMPKSSKMKFLESISMELSDVDDIRNLLLLCTGIEQAFDRLDISFVPPANPFAGDFCLRIWNDKVRKYPIYPGSSELIGSYDGQIMNFNINGRIHNPFKRAISYQAYHSYRKWSEHISDLPVLIDSDTSLYEGSFREDYAKLVGRHIAEEVSEDEM